MVSVIEIIKFNNLDQPDETTIFLGGGIAKKSAAFCVDLIL